VQGSPGSSVDWTAILAISLGVWLVASLVLALALGRAFTDAPRRRVR